MAYTQTPNYQGVIYVTPTGACTRTGDSWNNAMSLIADAQVIAPNINADVWVASGVYFGDTLSDNALTMYGVNVYGGFVGTEPSDYDLIMRDFETNATII